MSHECPAPNCDRRITDRTEINNEYDHHGENARLRVLQSQAVTYWTEQLA